MAETGVKMVPRSSKAQSAMFRYIVPAGDFIIIMLGKGHVVRAEVTDEGWYRVEWWD